MSLRLFFVVVFGFAGFSLQAAEEVARPWDLAAKPWNPAGRELLPIQAGIVVYANYNAVLLRGPGADNSINSGFGHINISGTQYGRGVFCHAPSHLGVVLDKPGKTFTATVGIDSHPGTKPGRGSVRFVVKVGGVEKFRSDILQEGMSPVDVRVDLGGNKEFSLLIEDGGDGISCDQSNWAIAKVEYADGSSTFLDEMPLLNRPSRSGGLPFSFTYDGRSSLEFLKTCEFKETQTNTEEIVHWSKTYSAPDGTLQITFKGKTYKQYPVSEYTVSLTNLSRVKDTKIISGFQSLDLGVPIPANASKVMLNTLHGGAYTPAGFSPIAVDLAGGANHEFSAPNGRSSGESMPFIELNFDDTSGWLFAVGWTGGWSAAFDNNSKEVNVAIGMINTHFKLLPGETIIQPGVTVFQRDGRTRREFKTLVHRFMLDHKVPRDPQGNIIPPIMAVTVGGGNKTPKMMLDTLQYVIDNKMPFDTYWIDAGWYGAPHEVEPWSNCGPVWFRHVGDWRVNTTVHPTGTLLPIAEAVNKNNMKLLVWFEPERIARDTPVFTERPDFRHPEATVANDWGTLLNLGNPEARKWIQDILFEMIEKHNIQVYRQDFNIYPARTWSAVDSANRDRVGIAEAKHIGALYEMLDEMRQRFPGILLENCASGGQRLDIEMAARAHAYCQSDYFIGQKPEDRAFILGQNATLNSTPYLPFHGGEFNCVPVGDDYAAFSIISSGTVMTFSDFDGGIVRRQFAPEETEWFKKVFAFDARMKKFYTGNFYPLTDEAPTANTGWCGWQFDRGDLDAGFAIVFRRGTVYFEAENSKTFALENIDPAADYDLEFYDGPKKTVKGSELLQWKVDLPPRSFQLFLYTKK